MPEPELPDDQAVFGRDLGAEHFGEIEDADQAFRLAVLVVTTG